MKLKIVYKELHEKLKKVGFNEKICNCGGYPECICQDIKPTLELAKMWFREKHSIEITVVIVAGMHYGYWLFGNRRNRINDEQGCFITHEKALEAGLLEAYKLLK